MVGLIDKRQSENGKGVKIILFMHMHVGGWHNHCLSALNKTKLSQPLGFNHILMSRTASSAHGIGYLNLLSVCQCMFALLTLNAPAFGIFWETFSWILSCLLRWAWMLLINTGSFTTDRIGQSLPVIPDSFLFPIYLWSTGGGKIHIVHWGVYTVHSIYCISIKQIYFYL